MKNSFVSFGAAREVTGSRHLITLNGINILIDCGMFQGSRKETEYKNKKLNFDPESIDIAICTHGHFDHCGNYPTLLNNGYSGFIYSTDATKEIADIVLKDSAHIQQSDIEYLRKKAKKYNIEFEDKQPLYTLEDVGRVINVWKTYPHNKWVQISKSIRFKFIDAGHILGSAQVVIETDNRRILFTGDLGRKGMPILNDPAFDDPVDIIITEATYGDRVHEKWEDLEKKLADFINKVYNRNGRIIVPSFAIGRTQELVYMLHILEDKKMIPEDMEIFVDSPMAINITEIFKNHPECYDDETKEAFIRHSKNPFGFNKLKYIQNVEQSKMLNDYKKPCIIISASGMAESGRVLHHLANSIEDPKNAVMIVGFMAQNTLGRRLVDKAPVVKIFGENYENNGELAVFNAFSAHADYLELTEYLNHYKKSLKQLFLVHGESRVLDKYKQYLIDNDYDKVNIAEFSQYYEI